MLHPIFTLLSRSSRVVAAQSLPLLLLCVTLFQQTQGTAILSSCDFVLPPLSTVNSTPHQIPPVPLQIPTAISQQLLQTQLKPPYLQVSSRHYDHYSATVTVASLLTSWLDQVLHHPVSWRSYYIVIPSFPSANYILPLIFFHIKLLCLGMFLGPHTKTLQLSIVRGEATALSQYTVYCPLIK